MPTAPIPGQPHPDVATVKSVLREIHPGETLPYETVAKAVSLTPNDPRFFRRCTTARKQLEREGVVVVCVPGEGFLREKPDQTIARINGRETKSLGRKVRRSQRQLGTVDVGSLPHEKRSEAYALMASLRVAEMSVGSRGKQLLLAAAKTNSAELASQQMLEVLAGANGNK